MPVSTDKQDSEMLINCFHVRYFFRGGLTLKPNNNFVDSITFTVKAGKIKILPLLGVFIIEGNRQQYLA